MQALEFHISAVLVNPKNGAWNLGCAFGNSTWFWKPKWSKTCKIKSLMYYIYDINIYPSREFGSLNFEGDKPFLGKLVGFR